MGSGIVRRPALGAAIAALVAMPFVLSDAHTVQLATVGAYLVAIVGLDVLIAAGGRVSLGQGALMGLGGYTTAILVSGHGVPWAWTLPLAVLLAAAAGLALEVLAGRGFAGARIVLSLGLAVAFPWSLLRFRAQTGGAGGLAVAGAGGAAWRYALTWILAAGCCALAWGLLHSRFGRSLRAVADSPLAATAAGLAPAAIVRRASVVSAGFAGLAGALLAIDAGHVDPGVFPLRLSLYLFAGAIVGLFGSVAAAPLGALLIGYLPSVVGAIPRLAGGPGPQRLVLGGLLVVLVLGRRLAAPLHRH